VSDTSSLQGLGADVRQADADLGQEKKLAALGPQGDGGGCTIALQTGEAAGRIGQGDGGNFRQDLGIFGRWPPSYASGHS
jgi:hypothetical protein